MTTTSIERLYSIICLIKPAWYRSIITVSYVTAAKFKMPEIGAKLFRA